jgi:hypothetical protein
MVGDLPSRTGISVSLPFFFQLLAPPPPSPSLLVFSLSHGTKYAYRITKPARRSLTPSGKKKKKTTNDGRTHGC